jgi:parallel beta-helix repeat protein
MTKISQAESTRARNSRLRIRRDFLCLLALLIGCIGVFSPALAKPRKTPTGSPTPTSSTLTGYTFCASENQYCSFSGQKTLAYGANGQFYYLTLTGGTACSNAVFGDPLIGSAKACYTKDISASSFDFSLVNQGDAVVNAGSALTNTITAVLVSGSSQSVAFSITGLPTGATGSFSQVSCNPNCSTVLSVQTSGVSTAGNFPLTIAAAGGGVTKTTSFVLTVMTPTSSSGSTQTWAFCALENQICALPGVASVRYGANASFFYQMANGTIPCDNATFSDPIVGAGKHCDYALSSTNSVTQIQTTTPSAPPQFDFSISNGGNKSLNPGSSATNTIATALVSGNAQQVSFSIQGLPAGSLASFSTAACNPSCSTLLTITTAASAAPGNYPITVSGTGGGMSKTTVFTLAVFLSATTSVGSTDTGNIYYVAKTGSDSNSCTQARNPNTPKLTINAALTCIGKATGAGAGTMVEVAAGIYDERIGGGAIPSGSSWSAPFTLRAAPGAAVTVRPTSRPSGRALIDLTTATTYAIVQGFTLDAAAQDVTAPTIRWQTSFVRLLNNELKNNNGMSAIYLSQASRYNELIGGSIHDGNFVDTCCGGPGVGYPIYLEGDNNLVEGVEFYNFPLYGISIFNGYHTDNSNNIIRKNLIHHGSNLNPGGCGIIVSNTAPSTQVYDNIVYSMNGHGMCGSGSNTLIYNNTISGGSQTGIWINNAIGFRVKNNIVTTNATAQILDEGSGTVSENNLTSGDPLFVSVGDLNFRLQSGSPGIGTGANLWSVVVDDFASRPRPESGSYDIGAYQN